MPQTFRIRCLTRSLAHRRCRRLTRRIGCGPRVDHLSQALTAFSRAIRAHRRLIKLAPEVFDTAVVHRNATEQAERAVLHRAVDSALEKVYGPDPSELHRPQNENRCSNGAVKVQFSSRKQAKIEVLHAELRLWLEAGRIAWDRHQHLRPHRLVSLGAVARMVNVAAQLGRLACGLPWPGRPPAKPPEDFSLEAVPVEEALARIYGAPDD